MISLLFVCTAYSNAVTPFVSFTDFAALYFSNNSVSSWFPDFTAQNKGVDPVASAILGSAPLDKRYITRSLLYLTASPANAVPS